MYRLLYISIHALVKRATGWDCTLAFTSLDFNPRPREEGDQLQSGRYSRQQYFNPRPREEGDLYVIALQVKTTTISIHALVKRATGIIL